MAVSQELLDISGIETLCMAHRLYIWAMRPTAVGTFVPLEPDPAQRGQQIIGSTGNIAFLIGVLDPKNEMATVVMRKKPVKQRGTHTANVQKTSRAGGKAYPYRQSNLSNACPLISLVPAIIAESTKIASPVIR